MVGTLCGELPVVDNVSNPSPNKSGCQVPPDWLRATMTQIVPSLQLAKTNILTPYTLHLIENFSAYSTLRAALFCAASPAERLRSAGSLAINVWFRYLIVDVHIFRVFR